MGAMMMTMLERLALAQRQVTARLLRLRRNNSGIAAVEFALVLPVMITMYLGCCEISSGFSASKKVDSVARALADLTSQSSTNITQAQMNDIIAAATGVMQPFNGTLANVTITNFIMPTPIAPLPVRAFTDWSYVRGGRAVACGDQTAIVPASFLSPGRSVVRADVLFVYRPLVAGPFYTIGNGSTTGVTLTGSLWMQPRILQRVKLDPAVSGTCIYSPFIIFP